MWILILTLGLQWYESSSLQIDHIEYNSREKCLEAANMWLKDVKDLQSVNGRSTSIIRVKSAICTMKN